MLQIFALNVCLTYQMLHKEYNIKMTKLQSLRKGKFTQEQLSKIAGLNPQAIHHYETGYRKIEGCNIKALALIAKALDCRIVDLLEDEDIIKLLSNQ